MVLGPIILGIIFGSQIGYTIFNTDVQHVKVLREEKQQLTEELSEYQKVLSECRMRLDYLRNSTIWMPQLKTIEEINVERLFTLIGANESHGGVYVGNSLYSVTTKEEIQTYLSILVKDPIYQKLPNSSRAFLEFTSLMEWESRLAIGLIIPPLGLKAKFRVVIIVKENDAYGVYKIINGNLKPFEKNIEKGAMIYLPL